MVLGVNTADAKDKVVELLDRAGVDFPNILDTRMDAVMTMMKYETLGGVTAVPMTYVIDREGKVVDAWYGYDKKKSDDAVEKIKLGEDE